MLNQLKIGSYLSAVVLLLVSTRTGVSAVSKSEYLNSRKLVFEEEWRQRTGHDVVLTEPEKKVNQILMRYKRQEIMNTRENDSIFLPAVNFMRTKTFIDQSKVFKILKRMPKGAVLHIHDSSIIDLKWLIKKATYLDHCYMCFNKNHVLQFYFFQTPPSPSQGCNWQNVNEMRKRYNSREFDQWLYNNMSLVVENPETTYPTLQTVWTRFQNLFKTIHGLFTYAPVFKAGYRKALETFYEDNVQYMEIRAVLPEVYELDGSTHDRRWLVKTYKSITESFQKGHPDFMGSKIISSSARSFNQSTIGAGVNETIALMKEFPATMVGYDLVGQEGAGHTLMFFIDQLLKPSQIQPPVKLPYFFHAGETDWNHEDVDDNLIDAVLLNTSRIGHGFGLTKHRRALKIARDRNISVEINPISNQVLRLVDDLRNHPGVELLATGHPVVVSSDDPALWGAEGVSYDWYQLFMGIASSTDDLRLLKKLAMDSIRFSAMTEAEKEKSLQVWQAKWHSFIKNVLLQARTL